MSLATNVTNLATRIATEVKALRTLINGNQTTLNALTTTTKTNLIAAINEVQATAASAAGGGATINDATTTTTSVWSSSKTNSSIQAATAALVNSAPAALDTLKELSDALGGDANFATTVTTALGNRVRVDAAQTFTTTQQLQARSNIAAAGSVDVGDTNTDFVATFVAGLA